jgi:hypothetical protein
MTLAAALVAALLAAARTTPPDVQSPWRHGVAGAFRSLFTTSRSFVTGSRYVDSLNRLRITLAGGRGAGFAYQIEADSQTNLGTRITLPDFAVVRDRQDAAWLDLLHVVVDEPHVYSDLSVYRATVAFRTGRAALTIGRQRIAWGTARFWSPADLFNPIDPLEVEGDVRQGVDAAQLEWTVGPGLRTSWVYARQTPTDLSTGAGRMATTLGEWDVAAFGGRFAQDWVGGGDVAGQWHGAGLRAEVTYHWRGAGALAPNALRLAAGSDYAFPRVYLVGEYFYNQGQPACAAEQACNPLAFLGPTTELFTLHRHFASAGVRYTVTPLLSAELYSVVDVAGSSYFFNPVIRYNAWTDVDVSAGAQLFGGAAGGEFHGIPQLVFAQLDVHF